MKTIPDSTEQQIHNAQCDLYCKHDMSYV